MNNRLSTVAGWNQHYHRPYGCRALFPLIHLDSSFPSLEQPPYTHLLINPQLKTWGSLSQTSGALRPCISLPSGILSCELWLSCFFQPLNSLSSTQGVHQAPCGSSLPVLWPEMFLRHHFGSSCEAHVIFSWFSKFTVLHCLMYSTLKIIVSYIFPVVWLFQVRRQIWSLLLHLDQNLKSWSFCFHLIIYL